LIKDSPIVEPTYKDEQSLPHGLRDSVQRDRTSNYSVQAVQA
jgi:hypothetical protein